jgi:hypothetical protein
MNIRQALGGVLWQTPGMILMRTTAQAGLSPRLCPNETVSRRGLGFKIDEKTQFFDAKTH